MASKSTARDSGAPKKPNKLNAVWTPQPGPQANAIAATWCPLVFYGGGKFSGKTDFLLGDYLQDLETYREHWQGIIFRRSLTEFTEMKLRSFELFPKAGGIWYQQASEWRFPKYAKDLLIPTLRFRYLERLADIRLYEGQSFPFIGVDELGDWEDETAFFRLLTFNRWGRHPIPTKRVRATGNPGGRGHLWIKKYFVDPAPLGSQILFDEELKIRYMFILGTYNDNQIGLGNDPDYPNRMNRAGSPELVRALKTGDFSVVAGAFFDFGYQHIIIPFKIPNNWIEAGYTSMDWGSCGEGDPFSIGWWAVADGHHYERVPDFPRGFRIRYREWYGKQYKKKVSVKFVADGIKEREEVGPEVGFRIVGGDIKKKLDASGPSIREMFAENGIYFKIADMDRAAGWVQMRTDMGTDVDIQMCGVFSTCIDSIEIIPSVQHSIKDANDIEPFHDDLPDEWRYGAMARYAAEDPMPPPCTTASISNDMTFEDAVDQIRTRRERSQSNW